MSLIRTEPGDVLTFKANATPPSSSSSNPALSDRPGAITVTSASVRVINASSAAVVYLLRSTVPPEFITAEPAAGRVEPYRFVDVRVTLRIPRAALRRMFREAWTVDVVAALEPEPVASSSGGDAVLDPGNSSKEKELAGSDSREMAALYSAEKQAAASWDRVLASNTTTTEDTRLELRLTWPRFPRFVDEAKHLALRLFLLAVKEEARRKKKLETQTTEEE